MAEQKRPAGVTPSEWQRALKRQERAKVALAKLEREIARAKAKGQVLSEIGEKILGLRRKLATDTLANVRTFTFTWGGRRLRR